MSKILSYNNKTTGEGWTELNGQYSADEIEMIVDPNGGLTQTPRTAIPSPFAQMDLVKNAFHRLAMHDNLQGELMDEKLVANALDIAQLFFYSEEMQQQLHIIKWNKETEIAMLKQSQQHRLLGETIEMFLEQDKEAFNFDKLQNIYFLVYGNQVIGSTSPVTLFMATPNAKKGMYDIQVEQNVKLFDLWRPLYMREPRFVKYIYALFTAYPKLKEWCSEVNSYIIRCMEFMPKDLHDEIVNEIGNPLALDYDSVNKAQDYLRTAYKPLDNSIEALGIPFYGIKQQDILETIQQSDFMIKPSRNCGDDRLPLVLQNDLNAPAADPFRYVIGQWDDTIRIAPGDYAEAPDKRTLPATSHKYPWLTDDDFLQPSLIKLDYTIDDMCFFNGNVQAATVQSDSKSFLLPLKPLFFKYFNAADLMSSIGGRPMFEMQRSGTGTTESVKVTLRIPVHKQGHFITLTRTYLQSQDGNLAFDAQNNRGHFVTVPFAISIFPFIRCASHNQYDVQLIDRAVSPQQEHCTIALQFMNNGYQNSVADKDITRRERSLKAEKRVGSAYYRVDNTFDYINVSLADPDGNTVVQGTICPKWAAHIEGHEAYTFAVDFGTTNTHMESMHGEGQPETFALDSTSCERLLATLYNGESLLYDALMKQEFLPKAIGADYSFPLRTVLSESERMDAHNIDEIVSLCDANLPFIYEKESIGYGNRVVANLKWSTETEANKRVRAFLTELAMLMRAKVLLGNGDLHKTRLVWFYPLSMKVGNVRKLGEMWRKIMNTVFGTQTGDNIIQMPESVAPYYFYKYTSQFRGAASSVASIDIGGGSSDVVVYEPGASQPAIVTSFRFAANVLFGDGFSSVPRGDSNPMITRYVSYFKNLFDSDDDRYGELNGILADIVEKRKSEDINAFLFSIEHNKVTRGNDTFSYNMRLNEDPVRKIIFIYFYCAIIYYVARMMKHRNIEMPRSVMFSGTGSKVLDIVGTQRDLDQITRYIFEHVYGQSYDANGFGVIMERDQPKQITCRGALMQTRTATGIAEVEQLNGMLDSYDCNVRYVFSNIADEQVRYDDMSRPETRAMIVESVEAYNSFFCKMCDDIHVVDTFLVDYRALQQFKDLAGKDLEHHLANGWRFMNPVLNEKNGNDAVEDAVFFYPIIGSIRDNLIENLKNDQ